MKKNLAIFLMGMTIATMVLGGCKDKENIPKRMARNLRVWRIRRHLQWD